MDAQPLSKLKASSHLKVKCFSGDNLAMKNLTAPTPISSAIGAISSSDRSGFLDLISSCALSTASSINSSTDTNLPFLVDIEPSGSVMNS